MKTHPHETTVLALFKNPTIARQALDSLDRLHLDSHDVSLISSDEAYEKEELVEMISGMPMHEEAIHSGKVGAITGAVAGAITAIASMVIAGAGLLVAGPIVAVITGAGGLLGTFLGAGFSENEAQAYDNAIHQGQILILVHAENKEIAHEAENLLKAQGAEKVHHHH